MNVLVVEDDEQIVDFIARGLRAEGYAVAVARTGPEGLEAAQAAHFSAIVLDLLLPGRDGREVCQELRLRGVATPETRPASAWGVVIASEVCV
jgi:two-component system, OmpR family, response regulator